MNPVSEDVKDLLVAAGIGVFASMDESKWGIFISTRPDKPKNVITIYDGEILLHKKYDVDEADEEPMFRIAVRSGTYLTARTKLMQIRDTLDRIGFTSLNGATYTNILQDGGPIYLGVDEEFHHEWVLNFKSFRRST